jgi:DNA repair exonuclease SbcCD ATPase subunit
VTSEIDELKNKLAQEEQSNKGLQSQTTHLKTLLLTMKTRLEELAKRERELQTSTSKGEKGIKEAKRELEAKLAEKERVAKKAQQAVAKLQRMRAQRDKELAALKKTVAKSELKASVSRADVEKEVAAQYETQIERLMKEREKYRARAERQQQALDELQREHAKCGDAVPRRTSRNHTPRMLNYSLMMMWCWQCWR